MGKSLRYVDEFDFAPAGKTVGDPLRGQMLKDKSSLGIKGNKNPGIRNKSVPVAPKQPMIPAYAKGGKVSSCYAGGGAVPKAGAQKIPKVMSEFKAGELHSGSKSGPVVRDKKQALAIALSEARAASKKK